MQNTQHNDPMQRCGGLLSRLAFERAERQGVNVRDLLRTAGLDFAAIEDPHARLSVIGQIKFVATVAEATGDPELGVHLARDLDLRRMEFLYYVPASADSMGAALRRLER